MSRLSENVEPSRRSILDGALRGLRAWSGLPEADAARLLSERCPLHWAPAGAAIAWDDGAPGPKVIVRGWACEALSLPDGRRQIYAFLVPGDICFPYRPRPSSRFKVLALTSIRLLSIGPALGERHAAGLRELLLEAQTHNTERRYDAALRLGQLSTEERVVDLLWELGERLRPLGLVYGDHFRIPLTQRHLADALGMSQVHLNRTLASLRRRRRVDIHSGGVTFLAGPLPGGEAPWPHSAGGLQDSSRSNSSR
jgi:CRP-like cAMP-binding protein